MKDYGIVTGMVQESLAPALKVLRCSPTFLWVRLA